MRLHAGCSVSFEAKAPTPLILMLRPRSGVAQWIERDEFQPNPRVPITEYTDAHGNLCQRMLVPEGPFSIHTEVIAQVADLIDVDESAEYVPVENVPDDVLQFLLPSRYCQADQLCDRAEELVDPYQSGYQQVECIRRWIHENIRYQYGTSNASTSALETASQGVGVCRDFTHLGIAMTRALNIPARMVVGYLYQLDPMDLHAWFEAFIGGRWYAFDPTQPSPRGNRIALAYGRDAADVALATQFGPMDLTAMNVWVNEAAESTPSP
jgi:transglutaminase-like putative cysteine protease